ncbi:MAG: zinc-binding dehydrogenase [Ignavibacteriales bacterium]|nr:zinc-binding dehydrogenase [Ignavibacteriales bacterium]
MRAIVKPKPVDGQTWPTGFQIIEKPEPRVETPDDIIIRVFAGAVCGTDVGIYNAKESLRVMMLKSLTDPITIGHEFSGQIVDAGKKARSHIARLLLQKANTNTALKKRLRGRSPGSLSSDKKFLSMLESEFYSTAEMHVTCGTCYQCKVGEKHVCRNTIIKGVQDDGAWATYVKVPAENIRLFYRNEIPPEIISFMDALGNATHTVLSAPIKGRNVAVLGCGVQGLMAVAVAKHAGAKKIFVTDASYEKDSHEKIASTRFAQAKTYGADYCFDVAVSDERKAFFETLKRETADTGVDAAYEMSGSYKAYNDAARIIRMGGIFSLLGIPVGTLPVDFAKNIIFKGITVKGIIGRRVFETWDQMEQLLKSGLAKQFMKTGFITHQLPMEKFEDAFAAIRSGDAYKVLLKPFSA